MRQGGNEISNREAAYNAGSIYGTCDKLLVKHGKGYSGTVKFKLKGTRKDVYTVSHFAVENDEMFICINRAEIIFVIIGSNDKQDWKDNFNAGKVDFEGVRVHEGFHESAERLRTVIDTFIEDEDLSERDIIFYGHSKGGAVCEDMYLAYKQLEPFVVTFGKPRYANAELSECIERDLRTREEDFIIRVYYPRDPVVRVPLLVMGFEHPDCDVKIKMKTKWWHFLPGVGPKVHLSYFKNIKELLK